MRGLDNLTRVTLNRLVLVIFAALILTVGASFHATPEQPTFIPRGADPYDLRLEKLSLPRFDLTVDLEVRVGGVGLLIPNSYFIENGRRAVVSSD